MVTIHDHFHWPWLDHFKNATTCRTNGGLRELAKQLRDDIQVGLRVAHLTLQTAALDATVFLDSGDTGDIDVQQWKHGKWCILPTDLRIWRMDDFCWDMEAKKRTWTLRDPTMGGIPKCLSRQTLGFDSQRSEIKWTKPQKMAGVDFYHSGNCCYFHSVQLASWQICRPIIHWVLVEMPLIDLANWMDGCHYDK